MRGTCEKVTVLVTVDDEYSGRMTEIVDRLRAEGMSVENVMKTLQTITGSIEADKIDLISKQEGIAHIEKAHQFELEPPDSDTQ